MALPDLLKHIYLTATEEVIKRGKRIYGNHNVELASNDELMNSVSFHVKDDIYSTYYKVSIQRYDDLHQMQMRCTCVYNMSEMCRHEVAALFQLQDLIDKNLIGNLGPVAYDQKHTVVKMKNIDIRTIRMVAGIENYDQAEELLRTKKCNILSAENEKVDAELALAGKVYHLAIEKNEDRYFDTSCTCSDEQHVICIHKTILFLQLLDNYGSAYFDSIKNWDRQKNKLLERYGYTLEDNWQEKFEFIYKEGKPFLRVLDRETTLPVEAGSFKKESFRPQHNVEERLEIEPSAVEVVNNTRQIAMVLNANEPNYPYISFDLVQAIFDFSERKFVDKVEKLDPTKFVNPDSFPVASRQMVNLCRKVQQFEINKFLNRNSAFGGIWENIIHQDGEEYPEEKRMLIAEFLNSKLKRLLSPEENTPVFYLPKGKSFITKNLEEVAISSVNPQLSFTVEKEGDDIIMDSFVKLDAQTLPLSDNAWKSNLLTLFDGTVYQWQDYEECLISEKFRNPLRFSEKDWPGMLKDLVIPLTKKYKVDFDRTLIREIKDGEPEINVQLIEKGDYLLFQPVFVYKGYRISNTDKNTIIVPDGDKVFIIHRDPDAERRFIDMLQHLHSSFVMKPDTGGLALKGVDVLKNNWFFLFIDFMKEKKIPVFGFEALKNFRFNTARPTTQIRLSSGVDWFDAKVALFFGNQRIGIKEIQKALSYKQSFVQLDDGSLGVLPEEWIKKYGLLFKLGEGHNDALRLSKYHLSIVDELYAQRDEAEISFELDEKLERFRNFNNIPEIDIPDGLRLALRPYQLAGFRWLNYLKEIGWGGILADDMGLGKTAQALSMLLHFRNENDALNALVVCPTTLIYNWENEIKKFTPGLSFVIHHGTMRTREVAELAKYNIVITTYGTLRSDIQMLLKTRFDYVILDESQAIKNPFSKVTKAVCLLQSANRICMSGTPLQNNTFDLYAQMNFLNPGLLGSVEFFRNEFSVPIDKLGETEQKDHLRKILYPFILRRTKEQVAKDLPDKTETILFCEMEEKQREIYEVYREAYRSKILGTIEEQGVGRSQLTILQGLMKLRQICDSPAILNEEERHPNAAIKLKELSRELNENIGQHKALVFSQFLGMLALIRKQLDKNGFKYEYFDGSTSAVDREKAITNFQSDDNCRIFLISLKAGGVGLNLTAADYVYIVDPWWNPAVEQQAIDRTHRIGQTKNIFAYRMICKDTIEDKILKLQERKRILAKELIADDTSFVKNLTREDVEYLFS